MKKPPRAAFAPTRELYACTAPLINDSVAQDGAAWVRHTLATGPELDIAVGSWTDPVVLPFLRGVERSFADCRAAGETPAAKEVLSERIVDYLRLGHDVLVDDDGFDRPLMPGALARLAYYGVSHGALMAKPYAQDALIDLARLSPPGDPIHYVAYGLALMTDVHPHFATPNDFSTRDVCLVVPAALVLGLEHLQAIGPAATAAPLDEEERLDLEEDRAGIVRWRQAPPPRPRPKAEPVGEAAEPAGPGVVIFPASVLDAHATAEGKRDVKAALGAALDKPLALTPVPEDWNAWETARLAISPWGGDAFRAIREGQAGRTHVGRDVICFVGPAGAGKSYLVREAAESLGVPFARFGADSAAENSFAGTNARYTTKHLGFVEQAMARHRHAGPMILVDELEKAAGTRHSNGGKLHDCLHGMWEPETAGAWHSVFLLHPVSLAHVPFMCTANSLDGLPASLLDRMRIVHVPEPGPEHLGVLAPRLARVVCRETGQDERFGDLDGDELAALADAWRGGSIRRLRRLVEICLRSRESGPAAMPRH
ncbi:AAA family ATPase [Methylorubrum sp. GM97]|uniref:AAA family ATPase n=1 Tax=Methylorubrum sp. GM97 TaxID=2938232 RepID=UPI0021897F0F|nr:AAA family ATPase [Methylorubrum sp. GM97]BDL39012.1 hypothetical protein MSPGM_16020 [Methylorubrum sp. GM97]